MLLAVHIDFLQIPLQILHGRRLEPPQYFGFLPRWSESYIWLFYWVASKSRISRNVQFGRSHCLHRAGPKKKSSPGHPQHFSMNHHQHIKAEHSISIRCLFSAAFAQFFGKSNPDSGAAIAIGKQSRRSFKLPTWKYPWSILLRIIPVYSFLARVQHLAQSSLFIRGDGQIIDQFHPHPHLRIRAMEIFCSRIRCQHLNKQHRGSRILTARWLPFFRSLVAFLLVDHVGDGQKLGVGEVVGECLSLLGRPFSSARL